MTKIKARWIVIAFEKLKSASMYRSAHRLSTFMTPVTFSIMTERPTLQWLNMLIEENTTYVTFTCTEVRKEEYTAAFQ